MHLFVVRRIQDMIAIVIDFNGVFLIFRLGLRVRSYSWKNYRDLLVTLSY